MGDATGSVSAARKSFYDQARAAGFSHKKAKEYADNRAGKVGVDVMKGAAGGAVVGFAVGGPVGAAAGAALGAGRGLFSSLMRNDLS